MCFSATGEQYGSRSCDSALRFVFHVSVWSYKSIIEAKYILTPFPMCRSFDTPAEWVRHMNSQHTEIELAMFNSKKDGEQKGCVS